MMNGAKPCKNILVIDVGGLILDVTSVIDVFVSRGLLHSNYLGKSITFCGIVSKY